VALHALEDAGFFCIDNLPPELLRDFLRLETERRDRRIAIAVDVRSAGSLPHLLPVLAQLKGEGIGVQSIFLDATTSRWCGASPRPDARIRLPIGARWSRRSSSSASCSPSCASCRR
jgi:hypothetical protein